MPASRSFRGKYRKSLRRQLNHLEAGLSPQASGFLSLPRINLDYYYNLLSTWRSSLLSSGPNNTPGGFHFHELTARRWVCRVVPSSWPLPTASALRGKDKTHNLPSRAFMLPPFLRMSKWISQIIFKTCPLRGKWGAGMWRQNVCAQRQGLAESGQTRWPRVSPV